VSDNNQNSQPEFGRDAQAPGTGGPFIPKSPKEALRPERAPEPPRRSRKSRSQVVIFLNFLMSMLVLITVAAVAAVYFTLTQYDARGPLAVDTNFVVKPGFGVSDIATGLERNNIITDARIFRYVTMTQMHEGETLKAGEYAIKAGSSMKDIMELLKSGKSILYSVTLPEGLTTKQIFAKLAEDPMLEGPLPAALPAEGSLHPNTYKFTRGTERSQIVKQMQDSQAKLVDEVWANRRADLPVATKEELVTLASIVEKETGVADERPHVAAVFVNRLNKSMRLQSDPTIIYGLFGGDGKPADRPIYKSDLEKQTPYNTYVIDGLPPTPIANPGQAALEAVANPMPSKDLYFVADGTGGHVFAATLEEHNDNVKRWRKIQSDKNIGTDGATAEDPAPEEPANVKKKKQKKQ
jgi:UPF0755 protein